MLNIFFPFAASPLRSAGSAILIASVLLVNSTSFAQTPKEVAMRNSQQLVSTLTGVVPQALPALVTAIKERKVPRVAPLAPAWILLVPEHKVLFYEGRDELENTDASGLVDDAGFAFGTAGVSLGVKSRGGWLSLTFSKKPSIAYCASRYPFVVCTMIPGSLKN